MRPPHRRRMLGGVSLYEALSLLVSGVGTLGTVYIGLRQLRQNAPARAPAYPAPMPVPYGPAPYGPAPYGPPPRAVKRRPPSVTAASLLLFLGASAHPFAMALYYAILFATAPGTAANELSREGVIDVLVFGGVAFLTALLGVFVARGRRFALWSAWVLGALSLATFCLMVVAWTLTMLGPEASALGGLELFFLGYLSFALVAYTIGAGLLLTARSRAFFRRA